MNSTRAKDWLRQAEEDFAVAKDLLIANRFAHVCFISQQAAEKAIKAVAMGRGAQLVKSHSVLEIARTLQINGEVERAARKLDQYYIGTRYPDAVAAGAPFEYYDREQAEDALRLAETVLDHARRAIP